MADDGTTGWELGVALVVAARAVFDALHERLAAAGHPDLRPAHGYAFQAIGDRGATASELAARLGVTKQAAGQMLGELERLAYVERDPRSAGDRRRRPVVLTARGREALALSADALDTLFAEWAEHVGAERLERLAADLASLTALYGRRPGLRPVW